MNGGLPVGRTAPGPLPYVRGGAVSSGTRRGGGLPPARGELP